jgi:hypothetical protein
MSEPQSPYSSGSGNPSQTPPTKDPYGGAQPDPYGGTKPPETPKDPCDEPKPPDYKPPEKEPCPPEEKPCSPKEEPCPPSKPCPEPPGRPCPPPDPCPPPPDPCQEEPTPPEKYPGEPPPDDGKKPDDGEPYEQGPSGEQTPYAEKEPDGEKQTDGEKEPSGEKEPPEGEYPAGKKPDDKTPGGTGATPAASDPGAHLAELKAKLEAELTKVQQLEPLKMSTADLAQRIAALEKALEGQPAAAAAYKEFYRAAELLRSEIKCFIPTVRCQLDEIKDKHRKCICDAIAAVNERVRKANRDSARANKEVRELETKWNHATLTLDWAKKLHEFLKSGLQQQINKQRDDLKALKALADPKKDQCEVWFYLYELEAALESKRSKDDKGGVCWKPDLNLATFLDCWGWECYEKSWNWIVVEFNKAEANEKWLKSQLEQAKKRATELDKNAKEAQSKRREWILKEIKAKDCCGPTSKCP